MRTAWYGVFAPALVLGAASGATACAESTAPSSLEFALNRAKWSARGPDTYTFAFHRSCGECLPEWVQPVRITVEQGEVTSVVRAATGEVVPPPAFRLTIDSLFAQVENTIAQRPYRLTINYDARLGYPTSVSVDYDRVMVDDEGGFSAQLLPP